MATEQIPLLGGGGTLPLFPSQVSSTPQGISQQSLPLLAPDTPPKPEIRAVGFPSHRAGPALTGNGRLVWGEDWAKERGHILGSRISEPP